MGIVTLKSNILFVDDEVHVIDSYRRMLRPFSSIWNFSYQTDSRAAYKEIQHSQTDLVVTDVNMPSLSGIELLELMKRDAATQNIPVIVITGQYDRDLKRQALDAGAADLMNKPVEFEELLGRDCEVRYVLKPVWTN